MLLSSIQAYRLILHPLNVTHLILILYRIEFTVESLHMCVFETYPSFFLFTPLCTA